MRLVVWVSGGPSVAGARCVCGLARGAGRPGRRGGGGWGCARAGKAAGSGPARGGGGGWGGGGPRPGELALSWRGRGGWGGGAPPPQRKGSDPAQFPPGRV